MTFVEVKGVQIAGQNPVPRLEIRDILHRDDYLSLFLRALQDFQSSDKTGIVSWFQIGGIHGRPYNDWNGVPRHDVGYEGYCSHASILFPPWHRSYLALFEQTLYQSAENVVGKLPPGQFRTDLEKLLPDFRLPYWDWAQALPEGVQKVPEIYLKQEWEIAGPNGKEKIRNPLYSFNFGTIDPKEFPNPGFNTWLNTVRYPQSLTDPNDPGQPSAVLNAFNVDAEKPGGPGRNEKNIRDRIYALLSDTTYKEYKIFSNTTIPSQDPTQGLDSLEGVHNTTHNLIGGAGHMGDTDYAGFDSIFWSHHCFIDRIFAFWQVLYPDSLMDPQFNSDNQTTESKETPLAPFHQDQNNMWTSEGVWNLEVYGNIYPELANPDPSQRREDVEKAIKVLYGREAPQTRILNHYQDLVGSDGTTTEYFATIRVKKHALKGSFNVHIFMGSVTADANDRLTDVNLVGTFSVFTTNADITGCERCKRNEASELLISGSIPLTGALLDRMDRARSHHERANRSLEEGIVYEYLKKSIRWEVNLVDGTPVELHSVPSLHVGLVSTIVEVGELETVEPIRDGWDTLPKKLPRYSGWKQLHQPTHHRFT